MLESLEIRGIRSFSPDLANTIQFDPKLTLIQGHNGAGKTTIIESLKAVTSGIFPPCSDNGRSFIFDPRISNLAETHAVIKLQFLTPYNKPVAIVRKYTLTLRAAGRLEIKKAENIVKTLNDEEKEVQKSMRVGEIDKLVPELIGLSPSVLQYVTFCHQDESYWPFSESGCLKTCLDQILNTETLSKAHDYHKKFLKKQKQNLVAKQGEVREMRSNTAYLKDYQTHMQKLTEERDKLLVQKRELEENLVGLNIEVKKFGRLQNLNQYLEQKISEVKTMKEHLNIPEWDSQRSEEELNTELKEIEKKFAEADCLIVNVQNQLYQTIAELANLNRDLKLTSEDIVDSQEIEIELQTLIVHYKELTNQDYDTSQAVLFIESLEAQYSNTEKEIHSSLEAIRNKLKDLEYDSGRSIRELQDLTNQRESYVHKISQVQSSISNSETQPPNPLLASFETLCINISQIIHKTVELRNNLLQTLEFVSDENTSSILEVILADLADYNVNVTLAYDQINKFKEENPALFRVSNESDLQQGMKNKVSELEEKVKSISDKLKEIENIHKSYQGDIQSNTEIMQNLRRRLEDHGLQKGYLTNIRSIIQSIETSKQKNKNKETILQRQEELLREIDEKGIEKENLSMFLLQQQEYKQELYRSKEAYKVELYKAQDYKRYKISLERVLQLENEISDTQQKLQEWDPDMLLCLKDQESNLKNQISQLQGRLAQMEIELSKKPPNMPANIHVRANRAWLECKILEQSINEHTSLLKHLDNTIIQYHQSKIEQINSILKSLWQKTYKGNDIETILLKAEPDNMNKGRSYNYRLLLQGISGEMEMRGRCSAGQRVVASIIIRIALAQAFSSGVSILTLDEPTTNLDEANTEGLAESIATLVSQERALQLIVISHDEAFIQKLKRLTGYATYFRLEKQTRSSVIRKVSGYNS